MTLDPFMKTKQNEPRSYMLDLTLAEQMEEIARVIKAHRYAGGDEKMTQDGIDQVLKSFFGRELCQREYHLSNHDIVDFMILGIAIEVKLGPGMQAHLRQLKRYACWAPVRATMLAGTRIESMPTTLEGKSCAGVSILVF